MNAFDFDTSATRSCPLHDLQVRTTPGNHSPYLYTYIAFLAQRSLVSTPLPLPILEICPSFETHPNSTDAPLSTTTMAEVTFDVTPATPQKRPYEDEDCTPLTSHNLANSAHKTSSDHTSRDVSPAPSSLSSLTELTNNDVTTQLKSTTGPQAKKPKLTFQEKEAEKAARKREKEEKERVKAEEKVRKEEEKARKDEEKRKANEEKENAKRAKDLEKAKLAKEKEAKKQAEQQKKDAKEAEKLKKERVSIFPLPLSKLTLDRLK